MNPDLPLRVCPAFKLHWVSNGKMTSIKRYDHDRPYILPKEIFTVVSRVFVNFNVQEHYIKFKDEDGDLVDLSLLDNLSFQFDKVFTQFYLYIFTSKEEAENFVLPYRSANRTKPSIGASSLLTHVEAGQKDSNGRESPSNIPVVINGSSGTSPSSLGKPETLAFESACKIVLTSATGNYHKNVYCNGCLGDVPSNRYKCLECPNFDLCARCEAKGVHPEHLVVRVSQSFVYQHKNNLHDTLDEIYTRAAKRRR